VPLSEGRAILSAVAATERRTQQATQSVPRLVLAAVPVLDAPPVTTMIAWPSQSRLRAVADLIRVATGL
jgi:hypothetical protein